MTVTVRLFAFLRDAVGLEQCQLMLAPGASGLDARAVLVCQYRQLRGVIHAARLAINSEYQPWETSLQDGDEVALIPPVSGG